MILVPPRATLAIHPPAEACDVDRGDGGDSDQPMHSGTPNASPRLLASVADLTEAALAAAGGADLIDLKDPRAGALGAWPPALLGRAKAAIGYRLPVSATIGDLPMAPGALVAAAAAVAAADVDFVKVGFFAGGDHVACAGALGRVARQGARLVAVLMADQGPDLELLPILAEAGFAGAMLDTADKQAGGLRRHLDDADLAGFVRSTRGLGLLTGLAGSLTVADIAPLAALRPDYLGFRGALCEGGREAALDPQALGRVRAAMGAVRGREAA
jgi:uncharacterized protein (UPF0264 family)